MIVRVPRALRPLVALAALALAGAATAAAQGTSPADTTGTPADTSSAAAADSAAADSDAETPSNPRQFISTDGAVTVWGELRPGEGINGFWWTYDPKTDLERFLDEDRRKQPLEKLTDAFGFQVFAPESIVALRDSVKAVADSILSKRVDVATRFDPKLTTRYSENRDSFDFVNELTSPVPLQWGTLLTTVTNSDNFNESTNKVRDGRSLATTFSRVFNAGVSTTFSLNRSQDEQRRGGTTESLARTTTLNGRLLGTRAVHGLGEVNAEVGVAGSTNNYETEVTDGRSNELTPNWAAGWKRPVGSGNLSFNYQGRADRGKRKETRAENVVDENGVVIGPDGLPVKQLIVSEANDRNRNDNLQFAADGHVLEIWTVRMTASVLRDKTQFIAQEDSVAGRQETRRNSTDNANLHVEGKPWDGLEVKLDGRTGRNGFEYDLQKGKFNRTDTRGVDADVRWDLTPDSKFQFQLGRDREDRNSLNSQAGIVDRETASANWRQKVTGNVDFTANYDVSLDSFLYDDKVLNNTDRDLRNQRGVFTVAYTVTPAVTTSIHMDVRKNDIVNVNAQKSNDNKTDYAYIVTPDYSLRFGGNSITGEFSGDARYAVYAFDEDKNFLTRRFSTRQRWQRALTSHVSSDVLGTYEISDEGSYRPSVIDGIRRFAKSREVRRFRIETQMLYNPKAWMQFRTLFRRDGDDQFSVVETTKKQTGRSRTDELTFGISGKKRVMKAIQLDVDAAYTRKAGDRVTSVDRKFYTIRFALEYRPRRLPNREQGGNGS